MHVRTALVTDLAERVTERRLTALLGPRRYGKTSTLRTVQAAMLDGGASVIWVDLYELSSWSDLASRLDSGMSRTGADRDGSIVGLAAAAELRLGVISIELRRPTRDRPDPVRTMLQHSFQELGILFAGSEPSTMQTLFTDETQPFYGQADIVGIEPFTDGEVVEVSATRACDARRPWSSSRLRSRFARRRSDLRRLDPHPFPVIASSGSEAAPRTFRARAIPKCPSASARWRGADRPA